MITQTSPYGISVSVPLEHAEVVDRVRRALANEGFGVLTEIDVRSTLKKKLDIDFPPYVILGACNPPLAYRALTQDAEVGLLLPCNVVIRAGDSPHTSIVSAMDPIAALALTENDDIEPIAREVKARLERALAAVEGHVLTAH